MRKRKKEDENKYVKNFLLQLKQNMKLQFLSRIHKENTQMTF